MTPEGLKKLGQNLVFLFCLTTKSNKKEKEMTQQQEDTTIRTVFEIINSKNELKISKKKVTQKLITEP